MDDSGERAAGQEWDSVNDIPMTRHASGWRGSWRLAEDSELDWQDCRVVDMSVRGLGITFVHSDPSVLWGRRLCVELPGGASSVNVRLEGKIEHVMQTINRDVRVGIEFTELSQTERAITAVLSVMCDELVRS
jgi:hypothetical protein